MLEGKGRRQTDCIQLNRIFNSSSVIGTEVVAGKELPTVSPLNKSNDVLQMGAPVSHLDILLDFVQIL